MSNPQRSLLILSANNGRLGIQNLVVKTSEQFEMSKKRSLFNSNSITRKEPVIREHSDKKIALQADLLMRVLSSPQEIACFGIRVTDTDANSYRHKTRGCIGKLRCGKRRKYSGLPRETYHSYSINCQC